MKLLFNSIALFCFCITTSFAVQAQQQTSEPYNTQQSIHTLHELKLAAHWLRVYRSQAKIDYEPNISTYIERLLSNLVQYSGRNFGSLDIVITNNDELNAFAVPGGVIGVHTGVFLHAENEAQISSILAHELSHLSLKHLYKTQQAMKEQALPLYAGILASILLASAGEAEASMAALSAAQAASVASQLRYTRSHEQEADLEGLKLLHAAGYNVDEMANMFTLLKKSIGLATRDNPPEYLLTHPLPNSRINEIRQRTLNFPKRSTKRASLDFQLIKALLEVRKHPTYKQAIVHYQNVNTRHSNNINRFALAMAYSQAEQYSSALSLLEKLVASDSQQNIYLYYYAKALRLTGKTTKAKRMLEQKLNSNPQNYPLQMAYIDCLNQLGNHQAAQQVLFQLSYQRKNKPEIWKLLAQTSAQLNDKVNLHQARAEYLMLENKLDKAQQQLEYALQEKSLTNAQRFSVKNRLKAFKRLKKEQQELGF